MDMIRLLECTLCDNIYLNPLMWCLSRLAGRRLPLDVVAQNPSVMLNWECSRS